MTLQPAHRLILHQVEFTEDELTASHQQKLELRLKTVLYGVFMMRMLVIGKLSWHARPTQRQPILHRRCRRGDDFGHRYIRSPSNVVL